MVEDRQLENALERVRGTLQSLGPGALNEVRTRATLINPILRALGWDLEDFDQVHQEYRAAGGHPVDYALLQEKSLRPLLFIEAKALGTNLRTPAISAQIMAYTGVAGVRWIVLTNGDEYHIYDAHLPAPINEKLLLRFRIQDPGDHVSKALGLLLKERLRAGELDADQLRALSVQPVPANLPTRGSYPSPPGNVTSRGRDYPTFWNELLAKGRSIAPTLHEGIPHNPNHIQRNWIKVGMPVSRNGQRLRGANYYYEAKPTGLAGGILFFERQGDRLWNLRAHDMVEDHRREVEERLQASTRILWLREKDQWPKIRFFVSEDFSLERPVFWPQIQDAMITTLVQFNEIVVRILRGGDSF